MQYSLYDLPIYVISVSFNLAVKRRRADIGVIIDTSVNFHPQDFDALQQLVVNLAKAQNTSISSNRIGALFFSNERWTTIPLNNYITAEEFQKKLKEHQLMNNLDSVEEQLKMVYDQLLGPQRGSRIEVPKLIILLTHENALRTMNPDALIESMKPIEKAGIRVVVAAVGENNHLPTIKGLIKSTSDIYMVTSVSDILKVKFAKAIAKRSNEIIGK